MDEIGFERIDDKIVPNTFQDSDTQKMRTDAMKKLEKNQVEQQVRAEAGLTEIPKTPESIPKELPKVVFQVGAKIIGCDKFQLTDDEAKMFAKHLSIIIGPVTTKIYSVIIILIVTISKVSDCTGKIKSKFSKNKDGIEIDNHVMEDWFLC